MSDLALQIVPYRTYLPRCAASFSVDGRIPDPSFRIPMPRHVLIDDIVDGPVRPAIRVLGP